MTAGLVAAALLIGTAGSIWQAVRATHVEAQADIQRDLAVESANEAQRQTNLVMTREQSLRRYLYAADLKLAWQAWHNAWNNVDLHQVRRLLARHEPKANQEDLRSCAWYHLKGLCGQILRSTLAGHEGKVYHLAISPDGQTLASASQDTTAKLWDLTPAQLRHTLRGHADEVNCVAFAPDGKSLATASDDRTVKFWIPSAAKSKPPARSSGSACPSTTWTSPPTGATAGASADGTRGEIRFWRAVASTPTVTATNDKRSN